MATAADYERLGGWASVLNPDAGIDRRGATRTVPMRVLHLGFPRSGTMSMQQAYKILGFENPYHFSILFDNLRDIDLWLEAFRIKEHGPQQTPAQWRARFDELLGHCQVTTDAPTLCFWRELVDAYPEAQVVLVERDAERWEKSFMPVLDALHPAGHVLRWTDPTLFGRFFRLTQAWTRALLGSCDQEQARRLAPSAYREHYAAVRAAVPKDRMLEYQLGSGWEPLCDFLGVEVPVQKFPHQNESTVLKESLDVYFNRAFKNSLYNVSLAVGFVAVVGGIFWSRLRAAGPL